MPAAGARLTAAENEAEDRRQLAGGRPSLRVAVLSDVVLSVGVGVRAEDPMLARAKGAGVPVLRRSTGGTGVLHAPGDLVWAVVLPRADGRIGPTLTGAYDRLGRGVASWWSARGHPARWREALGRSRGCCLLSERGRVLTADGRVVGGAAQHRTGSALLHHGVVPRAIDRELHRTIFDFAGPADIERLAGWSELGIDRAPGAAAAEIDAALRAALAIPDASRP